jgi:hypothetical protein
MVEELYKWILLYEGHSKYDNVFGCNLDNVYRCFSLLYRVRRVGTEAAVALWYNTTRVSTLTHGNVLDASYAQSPSLIFIHFSVIFSTILHNIHY